MMRNGIVKIIKLNWYWNFCLFLLNNQKKIDLNKEDDSRPLPFSSFFVWYDCQVLTLRGQVWSQIFNITLTLYTSLQWGLECFIYVGLWLGFLLFFCFMDLSFHLGKKKKCRKNYYQLWNLCSCTKCLPSPWPLSCPVKVWEWLI